MGTHNANVDGPERKNKEQLLKIQTEFSPLNAVQNPGKHKWSQVSLPSDNDYEGETTESSKRIEELKKAFPKKDDPKDDK